MKFAISAIPHVKLKIFKNYFWLCTQEQLQLVTSLKDGLM
jgi:hypothetical protein